MMETHELGSYEYKCPSCKKGEELVFKEVRGENIFFHCCSCRKDFLVKDRESGYIHKKILSLKERYPDQLRERNNKTGRLQKKRNRTRETRELEEDISLG